MYISKDREAEQGYLQGSFDFISNLNSYIQEGNVGVFIAPQIVYFMV